ncbi:MAG: M28 family metallopeptidase [Pseudomonadota bacterium]
MKRTIVGAGLSALLFVSAPHAGAADPDIKADAVKAHMTFLASDALKGRDAGSPEYEIAAEYVASRFLGWGLKPIGEGGTYFQDVTLRSVVRDIEEGSVRVGKRRRGKMKVPAEVLPSASALYAESEAKGEVVFVGYGISAPELGYDDYEGLDVEGRIVAYVRGYPEEMLASDIGAHLSGGGEVAKTAGEKGAIGLITLWTPKMERRWSYDRLVRSASRSSMTWVGPDGKADVSSPALQANAVFSQDAAAELFEGAETSFEEIAAAVDEGAPLQGFALGKQVRIRQKSEQTDVVSRNVMAVLEGSDPVLKNEYVVLTAHLDHIGLSQTVDGDNINNGAMDNAAGVATMLEAAHAFVHSGERPKRSIIFLAVTAEEKGLLGAEYWTNNPTVPIENVVANVNLDMPVLLYDFEDVVAFGAERSSLGPITERAAGKLGVALSPDPMPEQNLFVRSDHYRFVQKGIPSVFLMTGFAGEGERIWGEFFAQHYHKPSDEVDNPIVWEAGAKFAKINYLIAREIANADERPAWNEGDFFGDLYGADR